jgi:pyruvate, water dikinase
MKYIVDLSVLTLEDIPKVGGKSASLGEMLGSLSSLGINIPGGFALTVEAYRDFVNHNNLEEEIRRLVNECDIDDLVQLRKTGTRIREIIREGEFPRQVVDEIKKAYYDLSQVYGQEKTDVAVRSSATAEDLPDASFAGQQETFLNVRGWKGVMEAVRNCFASLFTDRAISYRDKFGFDHFDVALSACIQKMVRSDLGASGVAFSLDTESGFPDIVLINGSLGLGEMVVQGAVTPDEFLVFKPTLKEGYKSIIEKKLGDKDKKMVYSDTPGERVKIINISPEMRGQFCIKDDLALQLSDWVCKIEDYYTELKGHWCPMDVEWALDGLTGELYIVQARPETIHSRKERGRLVEYKIQDPNREDRLVGTGVAVGDGIASGKSRVMYSLDGRDGSMDEKDFENGDILITEMTDPDWEPIMKKSSAIITNKGGRTCHAAIVAREMGIPAIVGAKSIDGELATERFKTGEILTVSCAEGDVANIYEGTVLYDVETTDVLDLPTTKTPIMMNVGSPEQAFKFSAIPNAGVGLAREEFIINNYIQAHPLALMQHKEMNDPVLTAKINELTQGYSDEETFFVKQLSYGIAKIGAAFYPNEVIVRFSDFKSNEYRGLLGGEYFEPEEENPMLGWRGASRYYSEAYREAFGMECKAIRRVREKMGLKNVTVMIPFCRTVGELKKVYDVMKAYGLERGKEELKVFLMAELPSNVVLADEFAKHIDGFSIGSNDLTQLTLGLDRDSELVQHLYDERDEAVKTMLRSVIQSAKSAGVKIGICGQGPSDFPDFAQFLVELGIDSISVTPDSVLKTTRAINEIETSLSS